MSREIRSRRAVPVRPRPLYARVLGLQYVVPSGPLCFVFFEGMIAFGVLLALAELVTWWAVPVLPAVVAAMVKLNDIIAGALAGPAGSPRPARPARPQNAASPSAASPSAASPSAASPSAASPSAASPSAASPSAASPKSAASARRPGSRPGDNQRLVTR